jgi:hypothetical protein
MNNSFENKINNLKNIFDAINRIPNERKKNLLLFKIYKDLDNLNNKFEYLYYKYHLKNKSMRNLQNEYDRYISLSQNTISTFFPYMICYNALQMA